MAGTTKQGKARAALAATRSEIMENRRRVVLRHAEEEGLVGRDKDGRIAARLSKRLLRAARRRSGVSSDTELLEYALARVALEDDFGDRLFAREGKVPKSIDLEF